MKYFGRLVPVEWAHDPKVLMERGRKPAKRSQEEVEREAKRVHRELMDFYAKRRAWDNLPFRLTQDPSHAQSEPASSTIQQVSDTL